MKLIQLKILLLFQNFIFSSCRTPKREVPSWIIAKIDENKNSRKDQQSNYQTFYQINQTFITQTTESLSPWPETSSSAWSETSSTVSTIGFESPWESFNISERPPSNESEVSAQEPIGWPPVYSVTTHTAIMAETKATTNFPTTPRIFQDRLTTVNTEADYIQRPYPTAISNGICKNIEPIMISFALIVIVYAF